MAEFKLGVVTKFFYGLGAVAYGVKDNGFTTFLMIYYNQVLGLSPFYTGLAILIALAVDAFSDPFVGHLSDNWRSRLGRRHPFMYAAIIPILLSYFYLWNPPTELSASELFVFLTLIAVAVRLFITFYEIPNAAMLAELSRGYDDRTALMSLRNTMGWLGGVVMAIFAYVFFLVPTDTIETGVLNAQGYQSFGMLAAIVMVATMLISALGTHKLIPLLPQPTENEGGSKPTFRRNLKVVFANPSFRALFIASLFSMMAFGVIITLQIYFATFLFGLDNNQIAFFPLFMILAALIALWLTPRLARGYEKRSVVRFLALGCLVITNIALILKLLDWLPENGDPLLLPILLIHILVSTGFLVALQTVFGSMTADLVEDTERATGHRIEGLYFAAISFSKKIVSGLGIFASGIFLSTANTGGQPLTLSTMIDVSFVYIPFVMLLYLLTYVFCGRYVLTRRMHDENLSTLKM
ncbi:MAG: MFS transporter [Sneathiella sp.]|uniref:MFS transporter n=1 Tax=Sneathiella sp. TaxID=1964365 RepID=UPI00300367B1